MDWDSEEMGWLRERPPVWPQREHEPEFPQEPRLRAREPYEPGGLAESYAGSVSIEDMASMGGEENIRVLVRFTISRLLAMTFSGQLTGRGLRIERRVAMEHLALLPGHDWERRLLERLVGLCRETIVPSIFGPLLLTAEAAAKRGHNYGAFDLYRAGYHLGISRGWWVEAENAATGIARLAQLDEARVSARLWNKRAFVLRRRIARIEAEAAAKAAAQAEQESG